MSERLEQSRSFFRVIRNLPTKEELDQNLRRLNQLLGVEEEDYATIRPEEIQKRVKDRIRQQDQVIYPQRLAEGRVTPEWRKYALKRFDF